MVMNKQFGVAGLVLLHVFGFFDIARSGIFLQFDSYVCKSDQLDAQLDKEVAVKFCKSF